MNKIRTTISFVFSAAHRMYNDESKEGFIHGHTFKVDITLQKGMSESTLNENGNVLLKSQYDEVDLWIFNNFDHAFIINEFDENIQKACHFLGTKNNHQKVFVMPCQPTCENIALTLEKVVRGMFFEQDIHVISIILNDGNNTLARIDCL
jgi:6-pyruvoyl-tetrahydropterin synthase